MFQDLLPLNENITVNDGDDISGTYFTIGNLSIFSKISNTPKYFIYEESLTIAIPSVTADNKCLLINATDLSMNRLNYIVISNNVSNKLSIFFVNDNKWSTIYESDLKYSDDGDIGVYHIIPNNIHVTNPLNKQGYYVFMVYSTEQMVYPKPNGDVCQQKSAMNGGVKLDCSGGFGASTMVAGSFGFLAAARAIERYLQRAI